MRFTLFLITVMSSFHGVVHIVLISDSILDLPLVHVVLCNFTIFFIASRAKNDTYIELIRINFSLHIVLAVEGVILSVLTTMANFPPVQDRVKATSLSTLFIVILSSILIPSALRAFQGSCADRCSTLHSPSIVSRLLRLVVTNIYVLLINAQVLLRLLLLVRTSVTLSEGASLAIVTRRGRALYPAVIIRFVCGGRYVRNRHCRLRFFRS